jgi:hypothetical protein
MSPRGLSGTDWRPGGYPLGSIESRAAARASVEPEPCISVLFSGRDPKFLANFAALDDVRGPINERLEGESQKQFQERMLCLPGRKHGGLITYYFSKRPSFPA